MQVRLRDMSPFLRSHARRPSSIPFSRPRHNHSPSRIEALSVLSGASPPCYVSHSANLATNSLQLGASQSAKLGVTRCLTRPPLLGVILNLSSRGTATRMPWLQGALSRLAYPVTLVLYQPVCGGLALTPSRPSPHAIVQCLWSRLCCDMPDPQCWCCWRLLAFDPLSQPTRDCLTS